MCPEGSNMSPWNDSKKFARDSSDTFMINCPSMPSTPPVWKIWWLPKPSRKSDFNYAKDTRNVWFQLCKRHQEILKSIMQRRPESLNSIMPPGLTLHAADPMYFVKVSRIKAESLERRDNSHSVWYTIIKVAIHLLFCTLAAVIRSSTRVESKACWDSLS